MEKSKLNAENLKRELWETLQDIKNGKTDPKTANAIAAQARGIISTVSVEIQIQQSVNNLSAGVRGFTDVK